MEAIVAGGVLLSWPSGQGSSSGGWLGPAAIAGACLCWALDNDLTRRVAASDPVFIAASEGVVAGAVNTGVALAFGAVWPPPRVVTSALTVGLFGHGASLVLFVLALRGLGAARTGAFFSVAPFLGAAVSLSLPGESPSPWFWPAAGLMALGLWLHMTEHHEHVHTHEPLVHGHPHVHDEHHTHEHEPGWDGGEPHDHVNQHAPVTHMHPHYPDIHHRHAH